MNHSSRNRALLLIAFLEGAIVMALELVGARFFAPFYGGSMVVWTIVLTTVVTALAAGYFIGGRLTKKENVKSIFIYIGLTVSFCISLLPLWANIVCNWFISSDYYLAISLSALLVLLIPNILLGTLPPMLIELMHRVQDRAGKNSGSVYAVSTVGGIVATFVFGFYLIPNIGLRIPITVIALVFSFVILLIMVLNNDDQKPVKKQVVYGLLIATLIMPFLSGQNQNDKVIKYFSEGLLGQVIVADVPNDITKSTDRILFVNRMGQTWVDKETGATMWTYPHFINVMTSCYPAYSDVLLLGLGGGTVAKGLETKLQFNLDVVELDERIKKTARKYFEFNSHRTVVDDARHYLRNTEKKYDVVVFDVFKGEVAPAYVLTLESFKELKERLKPGGMILINFNGFLTGEIGKPGRSIYKTLKEAGCYVEIVPTQGEEKDRNVLYVASFSPLKFEKPRLQISLDGSQKMPADLLYNADSLDLRDAIILTDDKPNLEIINIGASQSWRNDYEETFHDKLPQEEIPMYR